MKRLASDKISSGDSTGYTHDTRIADQIVELYLDGWPISDVARIAGTPVAEVVRVITDLLTRQCA